LSSDFLVVGCTSEIGSGIVKELLQMGFIVDGIRYKSECRVEDNRHRCLSADLFSADLSELASCFNPRKLILASWYTKHGDFWASGLNTLWLEMYIDLCSTFLANGLQGVIGIGSCAEYSWDHQEPLAESAETKPASLYGKSKLELYAWLQDSKCELLWLRPFFVYGPNDDDSKVIKSSIIAKKSNSLLKLKNILDEIDFVYIDDVIAISSKLISMGAQGVFNLGTGRSSSSLDIVKTTGCAYVIQDFEQDKSDTSSSKFVIANNEKLVDTLEDVNWTKLSDGIAKMMNISETRWQFERGDHNKI